MTLLLSKPLSLFQMNLVEGKGLPFPSRLVPTVPLSIRGLRSCLSSARAEGCFCGVNNKIVLVLPSVQVRSGV